MPDKLEDCVESVLDDNPNYDESRAYAICNATLDIESDLDADLSRADVIEAATDVAGAISQQAVEGSEFVEGDAVQWTWDDEPVHGRVARVTTGEVTPPGADQPITGDEGEPVYVIDEWDDDAEAYRRENVAKPESSLNESQRDLPPRAEENYAAAQIIQNATPVDESTFTPLELDLAAIETDVLRRASCGATVIWASPDGDISYKAEIPDKYVEETDLTEDDFVPNADVAEAAQQAIDYVDEHGMPNPDDQQEGMTRAHQLVDYHDRGEPLAPAFWQEIENFHSRHRAQDNHECDESEYDPCMADPGYFSDHTWGSDAALEQAERIVSVMDEVDGTESEAEVDVMDDAVAMKGPAGTLAEAPDATADITKEGTNEIDVEALPEAHQSALEADDFLIYGKASIEQWDEDDVPTKIQMDALEDALDRFFESDQAPGIISRYHQDIPVGRPVREHELEADTSLQLATPDGEPEVYGFEAGEHLRTHVKDADDDGSPELWLLSNLANDTEPAKRARLLALQGDLDGYSVTIHRNKDEMTDEGRVVEKCDLHAVTLGTGDQIKNAGSTFDVAEFKAAVRSQMGLASDTIDQMASAVASALK